MIPRVTDVKVLDGYRLWLRFHDGIAGIIDLSDELWGSMFESLKARSLFDQASVHTELQTVTWPNGADLAPEFLYQEAVRANESAEGSKRQASL